MSWNERGKKRSWSNFKYVEKTPQNLSQDSRSPGLTRNLPNVRQVWHSCIWLYWRIPWSPHVWLKWVSAGFNDLWTQIWASGSGGLNLPSSTAKTACFLIYMPSRDRGSTWQHSGGPEGTKRERRTHYPTISVFRAPTSSCKVSVPSILPVQSTW
jgi:hypothetical protein